VGRDFADGAGDYGGSGTVHPSGFAMSHIYQPVLFMNPLIGGLAPESCDVVSIDTGYTLTPGTSGKI
jgi:hypothetical protein